MTDYRKEKYWSKFADNFNEEQTYIVGEAVQQVILERLSGESDLGELVELGCGAGFYTKVLAENANHVMATDLSDEMLAVARTQLKECQNVIIEKTDCEKTAFPDGKFDSVFMANLVHIIENPSIVLHESYRILKDGGLIFIIDYTGYGMKRFEMMKMGIRFIVKWGKPLSYFRSRLSPDELRSLVEGVGFKVEEVELMGDKAKALFLKGRKG
ncbi:MAG TPA: methyltransferase domain-containing protein [Dehalococcoidia bacterium]|nr:methyltransferase domain-containing protein [Dehalococcoidia bacterium]